MDVPLFSPGMPRPSIGIQTTPQSFVIPAKAGIQSLEASGVMQSLDPGVRRDDGVEGEWFKMPEFHGG